MEENFLSSLIFHPRGVRMGGVNNIRQCDRYSYFVLYVAVVAECVIPDKPSKIILVGLLVSSVIILCGIWSKH